MLILTLILAAAAALLLAYLLLLRRELKRMTQQLYLYNKGTTGKN